MQRELRRRAKRYTLLRAAARAIAPSLRAGEHDAMLEDRFQELRGWMKNLQAAGGEAEPSAMAKIESGLEELGGLLRQRVGEVPLAQFRATLPRLWRTHPEEVVALLELCLVDPEGPGNWWGLIDYLITLLACEEQGNRRQVVRDPTSVTRRLEAMCARAAEYADEQSLNIACEFEEAASSLDSGRPPDAIVERVRGTKERVRERMLVPDVLRAMVAYNVAVWNRREELSEAQRAFEDAEVAALGGERGESSDGTDNGAPVLESEPLAAVAAALATLIDYRRPEPSTAADVAAALEHERIGGFEKAAFADPGAEPHRIVVRAAVTVGLMLRKLSTLEEALTAVGIEPEHVRGPWLLELESRLQTEVEALISDNRFDDARKLAETSSRFLTPPEDGVSAWALERSADETERMGGVAPTRKPKSKGPREPKADRSRTARAAGDEPRRLGARQIALAVALVAVCGGAIVARVQQNAEQNVSIYSSSALQHVSPYLAAGYRDGHGNGPSFIGTVSASWRGLPYEERMEAGRELVGRLEMQGITRVMLFDGKHRSQLSYARGRLRVSNPNRS